MLLDLIPRPAEPGTLEDIFTSTHPSTEPPPTESDQKP